MVTITQLPTETAINLIEGCASELYKLGIRKHSHLFVVEKGDIEEVSPSVRIEETRADGFYLVGMFAGDQFLFAQGYENGELLRDVRTNSASDYKNLVSELS